MSRTVNQVTKRVSSFPRVSGDEPVRAAALAVYLSVFPACAGMSRLDDDRGQRNGGFPRVSGDEPYSKRSTATNTKFSPRERG